MQMEARVGVVEGGQRALSSCHGGVDGGAIKFLQQQQQQPPPPPPRHHHQAQMGTAYELLAGGVAGAFSKTCTAPLARLTILFQVAFWFNVSVCMMGLFTAPIGWICMDLFCCNWRMKTLLGFLFISSLVYWFHVFLFFQVQGMHCEAAARSKACMWQEASRIINEEGFKAFWKGNLVTIAHRLPYTAFNFYAYERYKSVSKIIT